jgi:glycosyltransferase involved in cell wall biosynthesis
MKKKLDILYLSHDSLVEGIGMSQIVPVVIGLSRLGWRVGVMSCEKTNEVSTLKERLASENVDWKILTFGRKGTIGGIGRLLRISLMMPRSNAHHCRGDLVATACAIRRRKNVLWDVRGLWVDQKLTIGSISKNPMIVKLARMLESISATNASAVSTLTKAVYPVLKQRHKKLTDFHFVIPTCTDLDLFVFDSQFPKDKSLLLSGLFNNYYDLEATKKFIAEYRELCDLKVVWCHGSETNVKELDVGESEIKVLRQFEMPNEIASSSFGLAMCKTNAGESLTGVMPTKVAEFLSVGRPVIVSEGIGDLEYLLETTRTGVVVRGDLDGSIEELNHLLNDRDTPFRCRALAEEHFDMEKAINNYNSIFKTFLKKK